MRSSGAFGDSVPADQRTPAPVPFPFLGKVLLREICKWSLGEDCQLGMSPAGQESHSKLLIVDGCSSPASSPEVPIGAGVHQLRVWASCTAGAEIRALVGTMSRL